METRNSPYSNNEDRMSKLPETLIHHILSFIDMKHAVQTSVLSTRWRYIWTSLPTLNFNSDSFSKGGRKWMSNFRDFVDKTFILRDSSDLQGFHIKSLDAAGCDKMPRNVNAWILGALQRKVEELSVDINADITSQFPQRLFNCKSLTKLELVLGSEEKTKIVLPKSMDLPRLKSLKLGFVIIDDVNITKKLFSGCPVLESLIITDSDIATDVFKNININSLELKHFELSNCGYLWESSIYVTANSVKVYAPNLASFTCKDYMSQDYSLENLSSLATADIEMTLEIEDSDADAVAEDYLELSAVDKEVYANRMIKFLKALHNVNELRLSAGFLEVVSVAPDLLDCQTPQFSNLRCLKLDMWLFRGCLRATTYLLKMCPNVESLFLTIAKSQTENIGDDWEAGLPLPCMLSRLKFVEIRGVKGCVNELKFLEFLLKNALVLEEMVLYSSKSHSSDKVGHLRKFSKQLQAFSRASTITTFVV